MVKVGTKRQENCLLTIEHHVAEDWNAQSDVNYILNTQVRVQRNAKTTIIIFGLYKSGCTIFGHKDAQYYCRKSVEQLESMVSLFMHVCAQHTTSRTLFVARRVPCSGGISHTDKCKLYTIYSRMNLCNRWLSNYITNTVLTIHFYSCEINIV